MMPAPKGNQFWKARYKHGRDKIFSHPDELWKAASNYFQYIDDNPIEVNDNKGTKHVNKVKLMRPYTIEGLCIYLNIDKETWYSYKSGEGSYEDFIDVTRKIENIIRNQKFEGAVIGIFKENIIARDLGLKENTESTLKIKSQAYILPDGTELKF